MISLLVTTVSVLFVSLIFSIVSGQVQQNGKFNSAARQIYFGKRSDSGMNSDKFKFQVPFHDSKKLLKESNDDPLKSVNSIHSTPFSFAKAIPVEIDSKVNGIWEEDLSIGVKTWSIFIESKTALALSLIFEEFLILNEGELYVMNEFGILGAFTRFNNKPDERFSIQPLKGSSLFLIYVEPINGVKPLNHFKIGKVVHSFRNIFDITDNNESKSLSGSCNVDVKCINSFNDQKRSTIVLMTDQLQKFCTGTMINNAKGDGSQFLLTANHCVFTDLSNSIAGFNYEKLGCGASSISNPQTAHGMKLLSRGSSSDYALFEVLEKIPSSYNVYMSGWDANVPNLTDVNTFAGIHHPSGDVKKISIFTGKLQLASWSEGPSQQFHLMIPKWTRGVTEPGSSGSPLFNSKGNLIGQLHGGASSCGNLNGSDLYGGFAFSFKFLKEFLDPSGTVKNLILSGRNLSSTGTGTGITTTFTTTATATATVTISNCQCVPKDIVDKLVKSYESQLKLLS